MADAWEAAFYQIPSALKIVGGLNFNVNDTYVAVIIVAWFLQKMLLIYLFIYLLMESTTKLQLLCLCCVSCIRSVGQKPGQVGGGSVSGERAEIFILIL